VIFFRCASRKPKHAGGRPNGKLDSAPRKAYKGHSLSDGSRARLRTVGQMNTQRNSVPYSTLGPSHTYTNEERGVIVSTVEEHRVALDSLQSLWEKCAAVDRERFRDHIGTRKRRCLPSSHFLEIGAPCKSASEPGVKSARSTLSSRQKRIEDVVGGDVVSQMVFAFGRDRPLLDSMLGSLRQAFGANELQEFGTQEIGILEALIIKEECRMSDLGYKILRKLLPKGLLPALKPVKERAFARSLGVKQLEGVEDGAIVIDPIGMLTKDIAHLRLHKNPKLQKIV
jgi:hypothetical protein